jgi:hypothetical protein
VLADATVAAATLATRTTRAPIRAGQRVARSGLPRFWCCMRASLLE